MIAAWLLLSGAVAHARPLTDGTSSTLNAVAAPGITEAFAQQNLHPRFGVLAGFERLTYLERRYSGWKFGGNWLFARYLGERSRANAVLGMGLSGMQGEGHGHSGVYERIDLDWENRRWLVTASGLSQAGNQMSWIGELQARVGYSPVAAEMNTLQPWFLLGLFSRSGTGVPRYLALLRLMQDSWWTELGTALNESNLFLSFSVAL